MPLLKMVLRREELRMPLTAGSEENVSRAKDAELVSGKTQHLLWPHHGTSRKPWKKK